MTPYLLPAEGRVTWFLCRFDTEVPIPVSVAEDATPAERQGVEAALASLEASSLGVRFVQVPREEAAVAVEFPEGLVPTASGPDAANTVADCLAEPSALGASGPEPISARMGFASVLIGRGGGPQDAVGRTRPWGAEEFAGLVLHELAHALGFQGHATSGSSVVSRQPEALRRAGRAALAREPLADAALAALYAVPSGTVLSRVPVAPARTQLVDRMARVARENDIEGPWLRVGDRHARIFWRDRRAIEYGLQVEGVRELLRNPAGIVVLPESRTRRVLPRERDVPLGRSPARVPARDP